MSGDETNCELGIRGVIWGMWTFPILICIWYLSPCDRSVDVVAGILSHGTTLSPVQLLQHYMTELHFCCWEDKDQSESGCVTTMNIGISGPFSSKPTATWQEDGNEMLHLSQSVHLLLFFEGNECDFSLSQSNRLLKLNLSLCPAVCRSQAW